MPQASQFIRIVNWDRFQHYKDRNPPWIKLHRELLTSETWVSASNEGRVLAIAIMMLAAATGNEIRADTRYLRRVAYLDFEPDLNELVKLGFVEIVGKNTETLAHASTVLADARPETETEKSTVLNSLPSSSPLEVSQKNAKPPPEIQPVVESDPKPKQPRGTRWPDGAVVPQDWHTAASEARARYGLPPIDLALEAAKFEHWWASRSGTGSTKVDWKRTWINWTLKAASNGRHNGNGTGAHRKPSAHDNFLLGAAAAVGRVDLGDE